MPASFVIHRHLMLITVFAEATRWTIICIAYAADGLWARALRDELLANSFYLARLLSVSNLASSFGPRASTKRGKGKPQPEGHPLIRECRYDRFSKRCLRIVGRSKPLVHASIAFVMQLCYCTTHARVYNSLVEGIIIPHS